MRQAYDCWQDQPGLCITANQSIATRSELIAPHEATTNQKANTLMMKLKLCNVYSAGPTHQFQFETARTIQTSNERVDQALKRFATS